MKFDRKFLRNIYKFVGWISILWLNKWIVALLVVHFSVFVVELTDEVTLPILLTGLTPCS